MTDQIESRITKKFCDDAAPHANFFAPDFKPTSCVTTTIFSPSSSSTSSSSPQGLQSTQRFSFSQSIWPNTNNLPKDGSVKLDIGATLVAVCNITGQLTPVPWPSSSSGNNNKLGGSPLKVAFQKIVLPGQNNNNNNNNRKNVDDDDLLLDDDDDASSNAPREIVFPKCSQRKTAARSFSFVSVVNELVWACEASTSSSTNAISTLQQQVHVNTTLLTSVTNEWLSGVASSSAASGSCTICLVFAVGIRLIDFSKLWQAPHLRAASKLDADEQEQKRRKELLLLQQQQNEKVRTHQIVLLKEDDEEDDPWALRGGVWVVSSASKKSTTTVKTAEELEREKQQQQQQQSGKSGALAARLGKLKSFQQQQQQQQQQEEILSSSNQKNIFAALAAKKKLTSVGQDGATTFLENQTAEDDIVQAEVSIVSLRCPLSLQIMTTPTKGRLCDHDTCFELSTFVSQSIASSSWNCPHCDRSCFYPQLQVDPLVEQALAALKKENHELMLLKKNSIMNSSEKSKKKNADRASNSDSDDDDDEVPVAFDRIFVYPASNGRPRRWERYNSNKQQRQKDQNVSQD